MHVINFDLPRAHNGGITEYVHRIGKTTGLAISQQQSQMTDEEQGVPPVLETRVLQRHSITTTRMRNLHQTSSRSFWRVSSACQTSWSRTSPWRKPCSSTMIRTTRLRTVMTRTTAVVPGVALLWTIATTHPGQTGELLLTAAPGVELRKSRAKPTFLPPAGTNGLALSREGGVGLLRCLLSLYPPGCYSFSLLKRFRTRSKRRIPAGCLLTKPRGLWRHLGNPASGRGRAVSFCWPLITGKGRVVWTMRRVSEF